MDWKEVAAQVSQFAPAIGALLAPLTGGVSVVAGGAIGALGKILGKKEGDTIEPQEVLDYIGTNPDWKLKFMQEDHAFVLALKDKEIAKYKAETERIDRELNDTKDARARDALFIQQGKPNKRANFMLAGVFGALVLIGCAYVFGTLSNEAKDFLSLCGGFLLRDLATAFSFEFGSTRSNDQTIQLLSKAEPIRS